MFGESWWSKRVWGVCRVKIKPFLLNIYLHTHMHPSIYLWATLLDWRSISAACLFKSSISALTFDICASTLEAEDIFMPMPLMGDYNLQFTSSEDVEWRWAFIKKYNKSVGFNEIYWEIDWSICDDLKNSKTL